MLAYVARRLAMAVGTVLTAVVISFLLVHATDTAPGRSGWGPAARPSGSPRRTRRWGGTTRCTCSSSTTSATSSRGTWGRRSSTGDRSPPTWPTGCLSRASSRCSRRSSRVSSACSSVSPPRSVAGAPPGSSPPAAGWRCPCPPSGSASCWSTCCHPAGLAARHRLRPLRLGSGRVVQEPGAPRPDAGDRRRGDHRPDGERRHARGARAGAHPDPASDGHAGVAGPLRARAAIRQRPGRVGAGHPVHRPVRRLGHHREPLRAAGARPGRPDRRRLERLPGLVGVVIVATVVVVVINLLLDLVVAALDPKVRAA